MIRGYAAIWDKQDLDSEYFSRGAFSRHGSIIRHPVPLLLNHDLNSRVGRVTYILEDDHGLFIEALVYLRNDEIRGHIETGQYSGLSVGFRRTLEKKHLALGKNLPFRLGRNGRRNWILNEIRGAVLLEISLTAMPCSLECRVEAVGPDFPMDSRPTFVDGLDRPWMSMRDYPPEFISYQRAGAYPLSNQRKITRAWITPHLSID